MLDDVMSGEVREGLAYLLKTIVLGWLVGVALGSSGLAASRTRGVAAVLAGLMRVHLSVCELSSSDPEVKLLGFV